MIGQEPAACSHAPHQPRNKPCTRQEQERDGDHFLYNEISEYSASCHHTKMCSTWKHGFREDLRFVLFEDAVHEEVHSAGEEDSA